MYAVENSRPQGSHPVGPVPVNSGKLPSAPCIRARAAMPTEIASGIERVTIAEAAADHDITGEVPILSEVDRSTASFWWALHQHVPIERRQGRSEVMMGPLTERYVWDVSGAGNCFSSRFADPISTRSGAALGICTPPNSISVEAKQIADSWSGQRGSRGGNLHDGRYLSARLSSMPCSGTTD